MPMHDARLHTISNIAVLPRHQKRFHDPPRLTSFACVRHVTHNVSRSPPRRPAPPSSRAGLPVSPCRLAAGRGREDGGLDTQLAQQVVALLQRVHLLEGGKRAYHERHEQPVSQARGAVGMWCLEVAAFPFSPGILSLVDRLTCCRTKPVRCIPTSTNATAPLW